MNLRQIEIFRMVILSGSITDAAKCLYISQPAVSRQIAMLEAFVGFSLFVRSKQKIIPTPEALKFFSEVERIFSGIDYLKRVSEEIKSGDMGSLSIACIPIVGLNFLPVVMKNYLSKYPNISFKIETRSAFSVGRLMSARRFDLGFSDHTYVQEDTKGITLAKFRGVCIAPKNSNISEKNCITPEDLEGSQFISLHPADRNRIIIDSIFNKLNVYRELNITTPYAQTIVNMVANGLGTSIVNPLSILGVDKNTICIRSFKPEVVFSISILRNGNTPFSIITKNFVVETISMIKKEFSNGELLYCMNIEDIDCM